MTHFQTSLYWHRDAQQSQDKRGTGILKVYSSWYESFTRRHGNLNAV